MVAGSTPRRFATHLGEIMSMCRFDTEHVRARFLTTLIAGAVLAACGDAQPPGYGVEAVVLLQQTSELPQCNPSRRGAVYYVDDEEQFYYCDGDAYQGLDAVGEAGASWLVQSQPAGDDKCSNDGVRFDMGPDLDLDGNLSDQEAQISTLLCSGEDGAPGEPGPPGAPGMNAECDVSTSDSGVATLTCNDGSVATLNDVDGDDVVDTLERAPLLVRARSTFRTQ